MRSANRRGSRGWLTRAFRLQVRSLQKSRLHRQPAKHDKIALSLQIEKLLKQQLVQKRKMRRQLKSGQSKRRNIRNAQDLSKTTTTIAFSLLTPPQDPS